MKTKILFPLLALSFLTAIIALAACNKHDEFDFTGVVVDIEECELGYASFGYAVRLTSPDDIGDDYTTTSGKHFENVVVIYGADRLLREDDNIAGTIYLDPNYSKTTCAWHNLHDCPEAVFTELEVL